MTRYQLHDAGQNVSPLATQAIILAAREVRQQRPEARGEVFLEQVVQGLRGERLIVRPVVVHQVLVASVFARLEAERMRARRSRAHG